VAAELRAEFGDHRDHAGGDAGHQPISFLPFVTATPWRRRQIGNARAPLVEHQVEAGAQPIPAFLESGDAGIAAVDREGDRRGGKCFP